MKFEVLFSILLVSAFAAVISNDKTSTNGQLEEQILTLFKKWQNGSVHTELLPLPSLKSFTVSKIQDGQYEDKGVKIILSIGEMKLTGLDNFSVEKLYVLKTQNILNISAIFLVPTLTLRSDTYTLAGCAYYVYSLKGSGAMTIVSRNNVFSINIIFKNVGDIYTSIEDFSLTYSISIVEGNLENSSWPLNKVLNTEGVNILKSYQAKINEMLRDYVVQNANEYLSQVTFKEFLNQIAAISDSSNVDENNEKLI